MFAPYKRNQLDLTKRAEDPSDRRLGHITEFVEAPQTDALEKFEKGDIILLGYPDDRGVDRNRGRTGACEGPDEIRKVLYKMTPSPLSKSEIKLRDMGNFKSWSLELLEAHEEARKFMHQLRHHKVKTITLGGGHDWAYSDFADWSGPLIHLDAHLDMRPEPQDPSLAGHSGTPFRRILNASKTPPQLSIIGLQTHCNARSHLEYAGAFQASTLFIEEMPTPLSEQWELILNQIGFAKKSASAYAMSLDMDVFAQSSAPGVSAPQAVGLDPRLVLKLIRSLGPKLHHLGIYETNPRYDQDNCTSRLAAKMIHEFLTFCSADH